MDLEVGIRSLLAIPDVLNTVCTAVIQQVPNETSEARAQADILLKVLFVLSKDLESRYYMRVFKTLQEIISSKSTAYDASKQEATTIARALGMAALLVSYIVFNNCASTEDQIALGPVLYPAETFEIPE